MKLIRNILICIITAVLLFMMLGILQNKYDKTTKVKDSIVRKIISENIQSSMTDYEKVKAIHDYIVVETEYDIENLNRDTIPDADYTAKGVLENHIGVCRGYAEAFKLLMDELEIPCDIESGYADGISHAWNNVKIDGEWYQIDVTYDDPLSNDNASGDKANLRYDYFLITNEQLYLDHTTKETLHDCTSDKYMYQEKEANVAYEIISSSDAIVSSFHKQMKHNKTAVTFYFPDNIDIESSGIMGRLATSLSIEKSKYHNVYCTKVRKCGEYYYTTVSVD